MKRVFFLIPPLIFLLSFTFSCFSYKACSLCYVEKIHKENIDIENQKQENLELEREAACHWLYTLVPRHRCQVKWYDLGHWLSWALLGNDDDGLFGEADTNAYCRIDTIDSKEAVKWLIRNPLHNFTFYVIGHAQCKNSALSILKLSPRKLRILEYQTEADTVFADEGTSLYLALHGWKPFISLRLSLPCQKRADFYLGWRERGNFGIKVQPLKEDCH